MNDHYKILGITSSDDKETIHKKYIKLMRQYHPDRHGNKFLEKCKLVNKAYSQIMMKKYGEKDINTDIPLGFTNLGFQKVPTLDQYIRKIFSSTIKN